jgi:hypothetical protein
VKRRSRLSLDPDSLGEDKKVPGFETEPLHEPELESATTSAAGEARTSAWSSAPASKRIDANENVVAPRWNSSTLVKGLVVVVLGALSVYLLRKRVF